MSAADAAATYRLANPDTYAELTSHRRWSPDHYENWLGDTRPCSCCLPRQEPQGPFKDSTRHGASETSS